MRFSDSEGVDIDREYLASETTVTEILHDPNNLVEQQRGKSMATTTKTQKITNKRSPLAFAPVERDFHTALKSFSQQTKSRPPVRPNGIHTSKAPAQVAASSMSPSRPYVRYTLLMARINGSPPSIVYLHCALTYGYQELKNTILDKLREDSRHGYYEIPPGLKTRDITVRSPETLGTSLLTEENFAVWMMWYHQQVGKSQIGESREGMLEVDLRVK
ncbi:MAG: hypothetical protein Q9188_006758 [Gyalolechia gomerana]